MTQAQNRKEIERLEKAFWQSMVDGDVKSATAMLTEPAVMVSGHGAIQFDHAGYEKMAADDRMKLTGYQLSKFDVAFPSEDIAIATYQVDQSMEMEGKPMHMQAVDSSTWVRADGAWKCVAHSESPLAKN